MDFLQFLGTVSPALAPTLLIAYFSIRLILELLKERRELLEAHRVERKEWKEETDQMAKLFRDEYEKMAKAYHTMVVETTALGRDMTNQLHTFKNEFQKILLELGKRQASDGND